MVPVTTKPGQLQEFVKTMTERYLPILEKEPGSVDAVVLTSDQEPDRLAGIAIWKSKKDAQNISRLRVI